MTTHNYADPNGIDSFPLAVRIASRQAIAHGLQVSIEVGQSLPVDSNVPKVIWRGTAATFDALPLFKGPILYPARYRWFCPGPLRGWLIRERNDVFRYVIEWAYRCRRMNSKALLIDAVGYQRFRAAMLVPVDGVRVTDE